MQDYIHRIGRVGRADHMGLAVSIVARQAEKVWYHSCESRGRNCTNTRLKEDGGCCIWYDEDKLINDIQVRLWASACACIACASRLRVRCLCVARVRALPVRRVCVSAVCASRLCVSCLCVAFVHALPVRRVCACVVCASPSVFLFGVVCL